MFDEHDKPIALACVVSVSGPDGTPPLPDMLTGLDGGFGPLESLVEGAYVVEVHNRCHGPLLEPDTRTSMTVHVSKTSSGRIPLTVNRPGTLPIP